MLKNSLFLIVIFIITLKPTTQAKTPIIGIVTLYSEGWSGHKSTEWNYLPTSYVKWIQGAGAKVVPVQWDLPFDQMDSLLDRLNGVVFTGGNIRVLEEKAPHDPSPIFLVFKHITEYILKKNQHGHFYPLWGTCMGFWNTARSLAQNMSIIIPCDDCIYVKRDVFPRQPIYSRMLRSLPKDLKTKIQKDLLSSFLHKDMIVPDVFKENPSLGRYLKPVAYSYDASGRQYVSMAESPRYPIYTSQFHPEKPEFELSSWLDIPHSQDAVRFGRHLAKFFVGQARRNCNIFRSNKKYLIENYSPVSLPTSAVYLQVYFFPAYNSSLKGAVEDNRMIFRQY